MKTVRLTEEQFAERQKKLAVKASPKPSKYKNVKTNGFDSKKEAARYQDLVLLEKAGQIASLKTQVKFALVVYSYPICNYISDFVYWEKGDEVVEDCKGIRTPVYRIKKKLMKAIYGIEIKET